MVLLEKVATTVLIHSLYGSTSWLYESQAISGVCVCVYMQCDMRT